jgi:hypothetical protein
MATLPSSAEWHRLAEQCRARADKLQDPIIRERMLMIADGYDRIAHDAEKDRSGGRSRCCGPAGSHDGVRCGLGLTRLPVDFLSVPKSTAQ